MLFDLLERWDSCSACTRAVAGLTRATACGPADTMPVRTWAKMLMMTESIISFVTGIIVIARAIGVLPG